MFVIITNRIKSEKLRKYKYFILCFVLISILLLGVILHERKTITVRTDGDEKVIVTYRSILGEVLDRENIILDPKDKINKDVTSKIANHDTIIIKKAIHVTVAVDGQELSIKSAEKDISSLLDTEGVKLGQEDKVSPGLGESFSEGTRVNIIRVETKLVTEKAAIDYPVVVRNDGSLLETQSRVQQKGQSGEKLLSYKIVYENGIEAVKEIVKEEILKQPVNEILIKGTLPVFNVSRGESGTSYSREFVAKSTAYYAIYGVGKTYTASGRKAVRDPYGFSTIAVDPAVIPLGTKVYVEGYGYAIAADTGESVKGNIIDVYFDTSGEARSWGVKHVKIYILK